MKRTEFEIYKDRITKPDTTQILNGESLDLISELRNAFSVYAARIGQELAYIKNAFNAEFMKLVEEGKVATRAIIEAEVNVNEKNEVSRRELQYLLEAIYNICNACASRLNVLQGEKR